MANEESGADEETTGRPQQQQLQPRARALTALAKSGIDDVDGLSEYTPRSQKRFVTRRTDLQRVKRPAAGAPRIAFSGLAAADVDVLGAIAASIGGSVVRESDVDSATHLVLGARGKGGVGGGGQTAGGTAGGAAGGAPKRTVKVLNAILRGAWLVRDKWLYDSMEAGELLPEEGFETDAFPGARVSREKRVNHKEALAPLASLAVAIVDPDPEASERLKQLAGAAGAVVTSVTRAAVRVGGTAATGGSRSSRRNAVDAPLVTAEWLYDTISNGERMPYSAYTMEG